MNPSTSCSFFHSSILRKSFPSIKNISSEINLFEMWLRRSKNKDVISFDKIFFLTYNEIIAKELRYFYRILYADFPQQTKYFFFFLLNSLLKNSEIQSFSSYERTQSKLMIYYARSSKNKIAYERLKRINTTF